MSGGHALNGSSFGSGDNPIVIQNINCKGNETSLTDCSTFSPTTTSTTNPCNDSTVAGIECFGKVLMFTFVPELTVMLLNVWLSQCFRKSTLLAALELFV